MKIANWNLERPRKNSKKTNLALAKIEEIDSDILVLTESSDAVDLTPNFQGVHSIPYERTPNEPWVSIWTKYKILQTIPTIDKHRTLCVMIDSPSGKLIIYGTIIPYHMAGVSGNRYPVSGYKAWEYHKEDIINQSRDWQRIQNEFTKTPLIVVGDFNQVRDGLPKGYGTKEARSLLSFELDRNKLKCLTGIDFGAEGMLTNDRKKGRVRRNVDHICVSNNWILTKSFNVGAWDHFDKEGNYMSDHNGVYLDIEIDT